jgi:hypothetical protein
MPSQTDNIVTDEELAALMNAEIEAAYDDASDHELEMRISKTSYQTGQC